MKKEFSVIKSDNEDNKDTLDLSVGEELKDNIIFEGGKPIIEQINWPA